MVRKPDFFILGAAKCGTTTLHWMLRQHPQIYMPTEKEPTFFCETFQVIKNPIDYFGLFSPAAPDQIVGEASHAYMSDPTVAPVLRALFPEARFVIILRNPADRAFSLYNHMRTHGHEPIRTFEKALAAEDLRWASKSFRNNNGQYLYNFLYFRSGLFGEQMERYYSLFPEDSFFIVTLAELKSDPDRLIQRVCRFLKVDSSMVLPRAAKNEGTSVRSPALVRLRKRVGGPKILRPVADWLNRAPKAVMADSTRSELMARFARDLALLESRTGISFA